MWHSYLFRACMCANTNAYSLACLATYIITDTHGDSCVTLTDTHACVPTYIHACTYTCKVSHVCLSKYVFTWKYACKQLGISGYTLTHTYIYVYKHSIHTYTFMHVYLHTIISTCIQHVCSFVLMHMLQDN